MDNIPFPLWQKWAGSVVPCWRRVVEDWGARQLVAYLGETCMGSAVLTLRVDEGELPPVHIGTHFMADAVEADPFQWADSVIELREMFVWRAVA